MWQWYCGYLGKCHWCLTFESPSLDSGYNLTRRVLLFSDLDLKFYHHVSDPFIPSSLHHDPLPLSCLTPWLWSSVQSFNFWHSYLLANDGLTSLLRLEIRHYSISGFSVSLLSSTMSWALFWFYDLSFPNLYLWIYFSLFGVCVLGGFVTNVRQDLHTDDHVTLLETYVKHVSFSFPVSKSMTLPRPPTRFASCLEDAPYT